MNINMQVDAEGWCGWLVAVAVLVWGVALPLIGLLWMFGVLP